LHFESNVDLRCFSVIPKWEGDTCVTIKKIVSKMGG
jgi:hypothetical protein